MLNSRIMTVALSLIAGWLVIVSVVAGVHRYGERTELAGLQQRIDDSRRENERLAAELQRMQQPQWLALLARQRLNYKQPDETVVFVYKSEKSGMISQPQAAQGDSRPNWQKWLDWLRGR